MEMNAAGKLRLKLIDVYRQPLGEKVDIFLRNISGGEMLSVRGANAAKRILIPNLQCVPSGIYQLWIDPPSYLPVGRFVKIHPNQYNDTLMTLPIDPAKVKAIHSPQYPELSDTLRHLLDHSPQLRCFEGKTGQELFESLDDLRKAGLLNIAVKSLSTVLPGGQNVLAQVQELLELRGDRFFARVSPTLSTEIKNAASGGLFHSASGALHSPPAGYENYQDAGSFKSEDHYGNLQVSFFNLGDSFVADIDIDDAAGLAHVFQVLRNALKNRPTHPYDIHEILIAYQQLDPGYTLAS